ncbi:hypothetical protein M5D96_004047 [Drosophila gunungcola]|uniref:Uncharacterized protein n=1 Tax=Drosophila gunungcola TaxID=103775 RepID=A0A9P9YT93_9MUSC|nr:hypothetical protein M5D96_004047 [Drosophila gunungcola]
MRLQHRYSSNPTKSTSNDNTINTSSNASNNIDFKRAKKLSGQNIIKLRSAKAATPKPSTTMPPATPQPLSRQYPLLMEKESESELELDPIPSSNRKDEDEDEDVTTTTTTSVELRSSASSHYRAYTTIRSNSTSAILHEAVLPSLTPAGMLYARPRTLNVHNVCQTPAQITQMFFGYVFPFALTKFGLWPLLTD